VLTEGNVNGRACGATLGASDRFADDAVDGAILASMTGKNVGLIVEGT